jgi:hypothetical protein
MGFDRDTLDRIIKLAQNETEAERAPDFQRSGTYFLRGADGHLETYEANVIPSDPSVRALDTETLALVITNEATGYDVAVYYSPERVVASVFDDDLNEYRKHEIRLNRHPAFTRLQQLAKTQAFDQKSLIRLLRAEFNGHVDERVIERFRTLKLKTDGEGSSVVAQGRAAVDKRIQQQISDERGEQIPTEIEVTVPVYDLDEVRNELHSVTVLVDVAPDEAGRPVFELTAVVNGLLAAERTALDRIVANLKSRLPEDIAVYYGSI